MGNNRVVARADGTIVQKTHYYPFGASYAVATGANAQPYKYSNKELDQMGGLNLYDSGARFYDPIIPHTLTPDPLAEKYYSLSPYSWVMNNPLRFIDPTGMYSTEEWKKDNGVTDNDLYTIYQDGDPEKKKSNSSSPISILENIKKSFSSIENINISSTIGEFAMNLFTIKESVTTSDGEKYDKYIKRTYENSAPDYLGGNIGVNAYLFVPVLSQGVDFNIGYVKNDGWVIFPTHRSGTGFDISVTGGITWGVYTGNKVPIAKTIGGSGYSVSLGSGSLSVSGSQDITLGIGGGIGKQWNMFSVNASLGTPISGQVSLTETFTPRYLRDFKW